MSLRLHLGSSAWETIRATSATRNPGGVIDFSRPTPILPLNAVPVVVDGTLASDRWEIRDGSTDLPLIMDYGTVTHGCPRPLQHWLQRCANISRGDA